MDPNLEYRRLVWDMHVGVLIQGPDAEILVSNPKALELLGLTEDQLLGKTSYDPDWTVIHEDGSPFPGPEHPVPQAITTRTSVLNVVMGVFRPLKQDWVWLSVDAEPQRREDGTIQQVVCTFIDITRLKLAEMALRESEAKYRLLADNVSDMITLHSNDGRYLYVSPACRELLGYEPEDLVGGSPYELFHPDDIPLIQASHEAALDKRPFIVEFRLRKKDGGYAWLETNNKFLMDPKSGEVRNLLCASRGIDERKSAQAEKQKLQSQLQQSQKMESLGALAGGVAHDMNNILGAILSLASAHLSIMNTDSPLHPALETIRAAAIRGGDLVKRLLHFARTTPGVKKRIEPNTLMIENARLLERLTLSKIRLDLSLEPDLRPVHGDAGALSQAIMDICVNAVDAMPEGGTLALQTRNVGRDLVELALQDTGCGMTEEVRARAMDPFFTTKEVGKGTGLGLAMVYRTVLAHHGEVTIQSEPGRGTRVRILLPAMEEEEPGGVGAPGNRPPAGVKVLRVLLVDDDELIRISTRMLVEVIGHSVTSSASGEEALSLIREGFQPDVIILDMNMPGLGGKGTLPHLQTMCPDVPVLLSTGRADQDALDLVGRYPHVHLLQKPFGLEELRDLIPSI
jgi:PAS domain S-box-containing protein